MERPFTEVCPRGRILYVDDSPVDAALVVSVIENAGFEIELVDTPGRCAAKLRNTIFDVLLIENLENHYEGAELVVRLRDLGVAVPPTYVISRASDPAVRSRALKNGIRGFLTKGSDARFIEQLALLVTLR